MFTRRTTHRASLSLLLALSLATMAIGEQAGTKGPHQGQVAKVSEELQVELVVREGELDIYILDQEGRTMPADQAKKLKLKVTIQPQGEAERELKPQLVEDRFVCKSSLGTETSARVKVDLKVGFHGHSAVLQIPPKDP